MGSSDIYKNNFKNIKKYVDDLYYKSTKSIRALIIDVVNSLGVMKKSTYDKNEDGIVDNSEKVVLTNKSQSVTDTTIRFGVNSEGKWGYIKEGADTVYPFKGDPNLQTKSVYPYGGSSTDSIVVIQSPQTEYPSGNPLDLGNVRIGKPLSPYEVMADEGYDGLYLVTIQPPELQSKTVNPTKTQQTIGPDTGYVALGSVIVNSYPDPTLQSKIVSPATSQQVVTPDSDYDGLSQVTVNAISLQSKTASSSTSVQTITADSGYDGLSKVEISAIPSQGMFEYAFPNRTVSITTNGRHGYSAQTAYDSQTEGYYEGYSLSSGGITIDVNVPTATLQSNKTVTPSLSQQVVTPDSGYDGLEQVTVNAISLQSKTVSGMTPSANWSGAYTNAYSISTDSGYTGMSSVSVTVPMVRDYSLFTASAIETPSTVYNGDTAQSNSTKMLRIAPTKTGMVYTNSYLELGPSSYMGNATAADVLSGKTFSSSNGIQLTGTNPGGSTPTGNINLGTFTTNGSKTGYNVSGYATCSFTVSVPQPSGTYSYGSITTNGSKTINVKDYEYISFTVNVPSGGSIQTSKSTFPKYDSSVTVTPDSGYSGMAKVVVGSVKNGMTLLWSNSSPSSAFAGQTINLNSTSALYHKWTDYAAILIYYRPHKDNTSTYYYAVLLEYGTINAHNNTSTSKFALSGRSSGSASATSGYIYERPFRFDTTSTITFGTGTQAGTSTTSNNVMIPVAVYGIS